MLKKLLHGVNKSVLPLTFRQEEQVERSSDNMSIKALLEDEVFMSTLIDTISTRVLNTLIDKYGFEPTDKYAQAMADKKKYISQLDAYLNERKLINNSVENELQQFLQQTKADIAKALESFSQNIQSRVNDVESRHGIDKIKPILAAESKNDA